MPLCAFPHPYRWPHARIMNKNSSATSQLESSVLFCSQSFDRWSLPPSQRPHPGVRATVRLVSAAFCWSRLHKDVTAFARACMGCQCSMIHSHITLKPELIAMPCCCFAHLHAHPVGPLPRSSYTSIFTVVDRTTRRPNHCRLHQRPLGQVDSTLRRILHHHQ